MRVRSLVCCVLLAASPVVGWAQHGGAQTPDTKPPREAAQFAFLIGQWELTVKPKATTLATRIHGVPTMHGTWKAWRAFEGWGIEDELRIVDAAGNPRVMTHFSRVYDPAARRWNVAALDVYRATFTLSSSIWNGTSMQSTTPGTDADGRAYLTRTTIRDVTPTSFRYQQDRSTDGGKSWVERFLVIEAKRTASVAPR